MDLLTLQRKIQVYSHTQGGWNALWAELTLTLPEDVLVHRTQCRSGDSRGDDPLHKEKSWVTYTQAVTGTDCHKHSTLNDQWLVALGPSSCTEWYVQVKQYDNLIYPVIPDNGTSVWLMKMVVAVDKGEIRTSGAESACSRQTHRMGRGRQVTWNNPDSRSLLCST